MFTFSFWKFLIHFLVMIDATLENTTSTITMSSTILTVSDNKEHAEQEGTSYFPYQMRDYAVMETTETTIPLFNSTESGQPNKTTQRQINLNAISDDPLPDLYIGMKADVSVTAIYPYGLYNQITIKVDASHDQNSSPYFELLSMSCQSGKAIKSGDDVNIDGKSKYDTKLNKSDCLDRLLYRVKNDFDSDEVPIFQVPRNLVVTRPSMLGIDHRLVNISFSTNKEDRQEICNFSVFLHESPGMADGEKIRLTAMLEIFTETDHFYKEESVGFIAKTSVLERNKTAFCKPNSTLPEQIDVTINEITTFLIHCWIPFHLPEIEIILMEKSNLTNNFLSANYISLESYGSNFEPMNGVLPKRIWAICSGYCKVPNFFVNRGYYSSEETTEADLVVFKVAMSLSASTVIGNNYSIVVQVKSRLKDVWNHTFVMTPEKYLENIPYTIELKHLSPEEVLLPSKEALIHLKITILKQMSEMINLKISTASQSNIISDPGLRIQNFKSTYTPDDNRITCVTEINNDLNRYGNQTKLHILLELSNIEDISGTSTWVFGVKLVDGFVHFEHTQLIVVATDHYTAEIPITVNKPEVLHDKSGFISFELYKILDRNYTSCMRIPVQGDNPPLLQMKIKTAWLRISTSAYNVTLIGENISCQPHGRKLIQISYPVKGSNGGYPNHMKYCILLSDSSLSSQLLQKCVYLCSCTGSTECQELFIFMANDSETSTWKLCELEAKNVE